ncbi:unnamed protein product [Amoebophrya sp. A25]|nr:unnamed protein product [Amoebophrya sp. A25]|eukprot:GSA25T00006038001.1
MDMVMNMMYSYKCLFFLNLTDEQLLLFLNSDALVRATAGDL